jgi:UDP-N-acetylmuramate dehydrogenase
MVRILVATHPLTMQSNIPLKPFTTFKIGGPARFFAEIRTPGAVPGAIQFAAAQGLPLFVLGGGSNMLVSDRGMEAVVLHLKNQGIQVLDERGETVLVQIEAGESWDSTVAWAVKQGYWGIENLSHIPGQAAAAVVQNIGAYGQQLSDVFESVSAVSLETGDATMRDRESCRLGYRSSIFNSTERNRWLITGLVLRLKRHGMPNLTYADLASWFKDKPHPSLEEIRAAVTAIRDRKFPFPLEEKGGNAGSFFKNLLLNDTQYRKLQVALAKNFDPSVLNRLHELRQRFTAGTVIKIPSAFLIEICGLKGFRIGGAQVNESQPLVLVNQGGATADDVLSLARHIRQTVYQRTGMVLQLEPELVGFTPEEIQAYLALDN